MSSTSAKNKALSKASPDAGTSRDRAFGIYVHWPFCLSKCPYCDFNSHVRESIDHDEWAEAYLAEIDYYAGLTEGRKVKSVFFGGGTPSLMKPSTVEQIITQIDKRWGLSDDCEITLEANPTSVEAEKFKGFAAAGVNRVSLGVQSLVEEDLKALGRTHSVSDALQAIEIAASVFFRYSFDLIYARENQNLKDWQQELEKALKYAGHHMSLYQLTIEPGTAFHTLHQRGELVVPDDELSGEFYDLTQDIMSVAGMPAYEVSNHARPGQESRHNLTYWHYDDYAGIGPGAHGRLTLDGVKQATCGHRAPELWLKMVNDNGNGAHPFEEVEAKDRVTEALMMGLRLMEGFDLSVVEREGGGKWQDFIDETKLQKLCDEGLLVLEDNRIVPTKDGTLCLNSVIKYLC